MLHYRIVILCLIFVSFSSVVAKSQINTAQFVQTIEDTLPKQSFFKPSKHNMDKDVFLKQLNESPSFGLGKDNYGITGIPTNTKPTKHNSDVKYQISIRQRLTKTVLPFNTYSLFIYNQKAFWDIYENSSPFKDINYNPAIGFGKLVFLKDKISGIVSLMFEHESNGRESIYSRSWNYISITGVYFFNPMLHLQAKVWITFVSKDNADLIDYKGWGFFALNIQNRSRRIRVSLVLNPIKYKNNVNTTLDVSFKISKNANQYFFIQFYNGYAEGLLNYSNHTSMIRVGVSIKQKFLTIY